MLVEISTRFGETSPTSSPPAATRSRAKARVARAQGDLHRATSSTSLESVLRVSLADKLFNARAILRDYLAGRRRGLEPVPGPAATASSGTTGQLADRFSRLLPGRMAVELAEVVDELERVTGAPAEPGIGR